MVPNISGAGPGPLRTTTPVRRPADLAVKPGDLPQTASQGMQQSLAGLEREMGEFAASLKTAPDSHLNDAIMSEHGDPAAEAVDMLAQREALRANIAVLKAADRVKGSLLDILA